MRGTCGPPWLSVVHLRSPHPDRQRCGRATPDRCRAVTCHGNEWNQVIASPAGMSRDRNGLIALHWDWDQTGAGGHYRSTATPTLRRVRRRRIVRRQSGRWARPSPGQRVSASCWVPMPPTPSGSMKNWRSASSPGLAGDGRSASGLRIRARSSRPSWPGPLSEWLFELALEHRPNDRAPSARCAVESVSAGRCRWTGSGSRTCSGSDWLSLHGPYGRRHHPRQPRRRPRRPGQLPRPRGS